MRSVFWLPVVASLTLVTAAHATIDQVSREEDIIGLQLGQRIQVDDGSCPTGQIKEVSGTTLTAAGVTRVRKCVPRAGTKTR